MRERLATAGPGPAGWPVCPPRATVSALLPVVLLLVAGCAPAEPGPGTANPGLVDLDGNPVDPLRRSDSEVLVFVFTSTDCPISNRYAPELERLHEELAPRGVEFWMVYPDPADEPAAIRRHLDGFGYPFGGLRDPVQGLVDLTGVTVTPEAAVFGPSRELAYRGRIDDWYVDFGMARPAPTRHDLREAVGSVLAGEPVERPRTRAVGCFIPEIDP